MPLTATDWAKLITDEKGRLMTLGVIEALASLRGWPLLNLLPFVPKQGGSYIANWGASAAQAATRAMNSEFTEATPAVSQFTFPMRAAGGQVKIDINAIAGDTTGVMRAGLLTQKLTDIGARLNRMWFKGDKDAGSGAEWHGANEFCADMGRQIEAGEDGAALTSAMMDDLLAMVPGANIILANRTLAQQIDNLNVGVQKTVVLNQGTPTPGMFVQTYKGVPILPVDTAPDDTTAAHAQILPFTETQGEAEICSRITAARIGLDGVHGIHHKIMELFPSRREGAFEYNDLNWFMAGLAMDHPDSIAQIIGVLAEAPEEEAP